MLSTSRAIDPLRFSPKIIKQRVLDLSKILTAVWSLLPAEQEDAAEYVTRTWAEVLYEQLRSIPVDSIGIVKCVIDTTGAEHFAGEQELRVDSSAIKSTKLVTQGK